MSGIVIFDLCDTLVADNTTVGFLRLMGQRHPQVARALDHWTRRGSPRYWIGAIAYRLGRDLARERLVASLAGLSRAAIEAGAADYAASLGQRVNAAVIARLEAHRAAGERVMILSSSLDPVVGAIARTFGVEGRGSMLGYDGDRATGRLESDLTGAKLGVVRDEGRDLVAAYSDNRTDLGLLRAARRGVLVVPRGGVRPGRLPDGIDELIDA